MSEHFSYNRSWDDIETMLDKAERKKNFHFCSMADLSISKKDRIKHMRNYKALEGTIKALRWCLGDKDVEHPLE